MDPTINNTVTEPAGGDTATVPAKETPVSSETASQEKAGQEPAVKTYDQAYLNDLPKMVHRSTKC